MVVPIEVEGRGHVIGRLTRGSPMVPGPIYIFILYSEAEKWVRQASKILQKYM